MKVLLIFILSILSFSIFADDVPEIPTGMYSGECYHQSSMLDPETTHYIGVMFDYNSANNNQLFMAPVFQFFGDANDMKDWSLEVARKEMSEAWKTSGVVTIHPTSYTAMVADDSGSPVYIYWARQNKQTKKLYFLSYMRQFSFAFCEARLN